MVGDCVVVYLDGFFGGVLEVVVVVLVGGDWFVYWVVDFIDFCGIDGGFLIQFDVGVGVINCGKYICWLLYFKVY